MTIAVVGAGGFLGGFITKALSATGHRVLPISRGDPLPTEPVEILVDCNGDARRFWANANPGGSFTANVASVAERVTSGIARRYVFMSTMDVYGKGCNSRRTSREDAVIDPAGLDVYAFHKWLAEQLIIRHAPHWLILRLGTLIGPGLKKNPVFDAVNGHPVRQTAESTLSLVDLAHAAEALLSLLERDADGIWNVTASRSITVAHMLTEVSMATRQPAPPFHSDLLHTDYDINIAQLSAVLTMPDSATMLRAALPHLTGPRS